MARKKNFLVEGIPIHAKWKLTIVSVLLFALILNSVLPVLFSSLDYAFNGGVSIILVSLVILFSLGSKLTEGIVIALIVIALFSNLWDFQVRDLSSLRNQILIGSVVALIIELTFGKISLVNLVGIIKRQLGVSRE